MAKGVGQKKLPDKIPTNKRHRLAPSRPNIESGITKPGVKRLARRAGAKRVSGDVVSETQQLTKERLTSVIRVANALREYRRRPTLKQSDVTEALKRLRNPIYGAD